MNDDIDINQLLSDSDVSALSGEMLQTLRRREKARRRSHIIVAGVSIALAAGLTTAGTIAFWPTNSAGQTYGPDDGRVVDPANPLPVIEPDLISAVGDNGEVGYVLNTDLNPVFTSPDDVAAWLLEHPAGEDLTVPLYDDEGQVIGTFTLRSGEVLTGDDSDSFLDGQ